MGDKSTFYIRLCVCVICYSSAISYLYRCYFWLQSVSKVKQLLRVRFLFVFLQLKMSTTSYISNIIRKKRDGEELTKEEIENFVKDVSSKKYVTEAQIGAMLMAIYLNDVTVVETTHLTNAMVCSGTKLEWDQMYSGTLVDKHSTGGVGDKISLVLTPALAACGMKIPMMSGRSLEHTGGTLNKLESIPGFSTDPMKIDCQKMLKDVGCFIISQSNNLAPADKIIYKIRDQTNTVSNLGLITGSIISKKAVEGINGLILDVKFGKAAFMDTEDKAKKLAKLMVKTSQGLGIKTKALLTKMDNPLGMMASNGLLEIIESIQCLKGQGPKDIMEIVNHLGGHLLLMMGKVGNIEDGLQKIENATKDGSALDRFQQMLVGQNVDPAVAEKLCKGQDTWEIFREANRTAKHITEFYSKQDGFVKSIDALNCAKIMGELGAFNVQIPEDYGIGMQFCVSVGDSVTTGQCWLKVHHNDNDPKLVQYKQRIEDCLDFSTQPLLKEEIQYVKCEIN